MAGKFPALMLLQCDGLSQKASFFKVLLCTRKVRAGAQAVGSALAMLLNRVPEGSSILVTPVYYV